CLESLDIPTQLVRVIFETSASSSSCIRGRIAISWLHRLVRLLLMFSDDVLPRIFQCSQCIYNEGISQFVPSDTSILLNANAQSGVYTLEVDQRRVQMKSDLI